MEYIDKIHGEYLLTTMETDLTSSLTPFYFWILWGWTLFKVLSMRIVRDTTPLISSAKGPLSGSGVKEDDEAWSVTSGMLSVGLSSESLECVALFSAINILN